MGEFSSKQFDWHFNGAFLRPKDAHVSRTVKVTPPSPPMKEPDLQRAEHFKNALFGLVMARAHAFMKGTLQDEKDKETERMTVVHLELHFDTNSFAGHTIEFDAKEPEGFVDVREQLAEKVDGLRNVPSVRVQKVWYDDCSSKKMIAELGSVSLGCKP